MLIGFLDFPLSYQASSEIVPTFQAAMRVPRTAVPIQINQNLSPRLKDHQIIFPNYELCMNQYISKHLTILMSSFSFYLCPGASGRSLRNF
jgi:hypothetical protein